MQEFRPVRPGCKIRETALGILLFFTLSSVEAADAPNRRSIVTQAQRLEFDHVSGFYDSPFRLNLSTSIQGAIIYYTTNATTPNPSTALRYGGSVTLATTTIVRAAAFVGNSAVTDVATRTYLFIPSILNQNGDHLPEFWGTNAGAPIPAHYTMAEANAASSGKIRAGLRAIPTLTIVTDPENLFSNRTGIYLHPLERGEDWERPASIELFGPGGRAGFRVNCGLRIHGGMSRRPEESPKHSFRLLFKRRYGAGKLNFPVFDPERGAEFDELILRSGGSDSWLDSNGKRRGRATYLRDEWMRQSMAAMGYSSARGQFVHLYLNGLYWGVYSLCERPGVSFEPANQSTSDYDIRNANQTESGDRLVWDKLMTLANSGLADSARYKALNRYLDLTQLADYLILNFYAGNSDWSRSANWYAIRPRTLDGKFQFFVWDAEHTFAEIEANTLELDDDESPMRLFHRLSENATFRALFAARAQQLLFGEGPLSPGSAANRFRRLADSLAPALAAESGRWGSYRASVYQFKTGPYEALTADEHWQREVNRITHDYMPKRRDALVQQFRERGLFPDADALAEQQ